jgi:hypothetical protein
VTREAFMFRVIVIGAAPETADRLWGEVRRIRADLISLLSRVKSLRAQERAIAMANGRIAEKVRRAVAGPSMSVDDGWAN